MNSGSRRAACAAWLSGGNPIYIGPPSSGTVLGGRREQIHMGASCCHRLSNRNGSPGCPDRTSKSQMFFNVIHLKPSVGSVRMVDRMALGGGSWSIAWASYNLQWKCLCKTHLRETQGQNLTMNESLMLHTAHIEHLNANSEYVRVYLFLSNIMVHAKDLRFQLSPSQVNDMI